jgi:hypothetical protein
MVNKLSEEHENLFDIHLYNFIDNHLYLYKELGLTPNMVTTFSLISGCLSAYMIHLKKYKTAGILFFLAYYFDSVDGKFARKYNMISKFGDYYDHITDIIKFSLLIYVLYKDNFNKFKKIGLVIILLLLLCLYHLGCQQGVISEDNDKKTDILDILKPTKQASIEHIDKVKYFGCGTFYIIISLIIFFWDKF